ncbi:MAG: hypothetical protein KIT80_06785 [Chitinophagaceae bacterium]|nr:hypothetical protein [Chitinophagaceae bacterium]MCW5926603.1 hypothetical protein [Chitinophagaceae bacterium]
MKLQRLILLSFSLLLLTTCQSPSDQIKDAFNKVDKSLETSNEVLNNSLENIYNQIVLKRNNNKDLTTRADTIYFRTTKTCSFLDSLKQVMLKKDTTGTNLDLATKLLFNTKTESDLTENLLSVYHSINSYSVDTSTKATINGTFQIFGEIQADKSWAKKYFETTPTIAAVTILTRLKNDCSNAATIALKDIHQRLK